MSLNQLNAGQPYSENPPSPGFDAPDPKNYATSESVAKRAVKVVREAVDAAKSARGTIAEHWRRNSDAYFNVRDRKTYFGRANVVDPEPFRAIETICARQETSILGSQPWIVGAPGPGEIQDDERQAEINEALLHQQLVKGSRAGAIFKSDLKTCNILGTSVLKVYWDEEFRRRKVRDPYTGKLAGPEDVHVYRGIRLRTVDLNNFFVAAPMEGETCDEQEYVIERKVVPLNELKGLERADQIKNVSQIKDTNAPQLLDDEEIGAKAARAESLGVQYDQSSVPLSPIKHVELEMYEGLFDLYGNEEDIECWIWIAGGDTCVRVCENPYWHGRKTYVVSQAIRVPGSFYGLSPLQPILQLWTEFNDLHNMGLDSAVLSLNPAIKVGAGAGINVKQWMLSPGKFLPCNDISQVEPFVLPPMTEVAHQAMAPLREMMRETTSATDLLQAQSTGGIDKATIYQGAITEANVRIAMSTGNYAEKLEEIGDKGWSLNQQYMDHKTLVRVMGRRGAEWIAVRPEDIKYPMDWQAVAVRNLGSLLSRGMGLERFLATATPLQLNGHIKLDLHEVLKRWWETLGMTDGDRIFEAGGPQPLNVRVENTMLEQRQAVDVHPQDDDAMHLKAHMPLLQVEDPVVQQMAREHLQAHKAQFEQKQAARQQAAALQAQQMMNAVAQPQPGNGAQKQQAPVPGVGNQQQFGADIGGAKEIGERLGGRMG